MITTVCMNPAFDKTVTVDALRPGEVNRVRDSRVDVGGKGVNVAIVAQRLGVEVQCIGCAGEDGADSFRALMDAQQVRHWFLTVPGTLRTNLKIVQANGCGVTEINERGAAVAGEMLAAFFRMAKERASGSTMAVVAGSLPPGCPAGTCRDLMRAMAVPCILDVSGQELLLGLEAQPCLIKPNIHELQDVLGCSLNGQAQVKAAARELIRRGAGNVLVSMGGDGAMLVTPEKAYAAPSIPVRVASTVGAGDSMVGGVLRGLEASGGDMVEALRWGVAAATSSVMTEGTQLVRAADVTSLIDQVKIQEV